MFGDLVDTLRESTLQLNVGAGFKPALEFGVGSEEIQDFGFKIQN
jgi:hypothetical protein